MPRVAREKGKEGKTMCELAMTSIHAAGFNLVAQNPFLSQELNLMLVPDSNSTVRSNWSRLPWLY
jgi:hypothetical protein